MTLFSECSRQKKFVLWKPLLTHSYWKELAWGGVFSDAIGFYSGSKSMHGKVDCRNLLSSNNCCLNSSLQNLYEVIQKEINGLQEIQTSYCELCKSGGSDFQLKAFPHEKFCKSISIWFHQGHSYVWRKKVLSPIMK